MVNSDQIFQLVENVAAHSSKTEKVALVTRYANEPDGLFKRVIEYAYNPFKRYGIAKRPEPVFMVRELQVPMDDRSWSILDGLLSRHLTGSTAINTVAHELCRLTPESSELFWRIIKKDMKAGFSESTCNKAVKGLIPEFPYMRCTLPKDAKLDDFDWKLGVLSQEKADGMFANLDILEGCVTLTSRQGSPFPMDAFENLVAEASFRLGPNTQSHGELLVRKAGAICAREIGNGILNSILSGGNFEADEVPVYLIWDQIPQSAVVPKGKFKTPYIKRIHSIKNQLERSHGPSTIQMIDTRVYHSLADAYGHYRDMLLKGKEGTIIKDPHAPWEDRTSKFQVKLKLEADVDLKIKAIVPGKAGGKNEGRAGSLTCETSCAGLVVDVTVKNEAMRDRIDADPMDWIERIIVVRANSIMNPSDSSDVHSLFLPRMVEHDYRTDKTEADSLQRVRDQFESAIKAV